MLLPILCCRAAGGDPDWAEPVAAAWGLLQMAAHLLDSVEDDDIPDARWEHLGLGPVINVATGLLASASLMLSDPCRSGIHEAAADDIAGDFHRTILLMCCGQHRDLTQFRPSLEACWQVSEAKSGIFFALACRAGARLAIDDPDRVGHYGRFGYHLGMLIQIGDDVNDMWSAQETPNDLAVGSRWTLPVAYTMAVSPPEICARLDGYLRAARHDLTARTEARRLIEASGAALYLAVEAERHHEQASLALERACSASATRDELVSLLESVALLPARGKQSEGK